MMRNKWLGWLPVLFGLFVVTACTDESPTEVGDDLLPSGEVRTFEIVLDPALYLELDTSFTGYTATGNAAFTIIANKFEGVLDANSLFRFGQPPGVINARNTAGATVPDSTPSYFAGRLVLRFDTVATDASPPVQFRAFRTAEEWDVSSTWTLRVDSGNVELPWSTPGGTRGASIDTATWVAGDTAVIRVDSATVAQWMDTTNAARGALVIAETPGARVRVAGAVLRLSARSDIQPDTVFNFDVAPIATNFIFNPEPPPASELRVGGVPSWRTMLLLKPEFLELDFPCPGVANCRINLRDAHVNRAELLLQPTQRRPGFLPEDTMFIQARTLTVAPGVPLQRSPVGVDVCGGVTVCLRTGLAAPDFFLQTPPAIAEPVAFDVTNYVIGLLDDEVAEPNSLPFALTLLIPNEPTTFGFATFAQGPQLRLVLTAPVERPQ
jgi:hypothetical protein